MASLAELGDVETVWQRTIPADDRDTALQLLVWASAMVRHRVPMVDVRIAEGSLSPDVVRPIVARMVTRAMANPAALAASRSAGGTSITYDDATRSGLDMTVEELGALVARPSTGVRGWGSMSTRPGLSFWSDSSGYQRDRWRFLPRTEEQVV